MRSVTTQYLQIIKPLETRIVDKLELCVICQIFRPKNQILSRETLETVGGKDKDLNQELNNAKQLSSTLIRDNVFS